MSARYLIPIHKGRITGAVALNLSGFSVEPVVAERWGIDPHVLHTRTRREPFASVRLAAIALMIESGMEPIFAVSHFGRVRSMASYSTSYVKDREETDVIFRRKMHAARSELGL